MMAQLTRSLEKTCYLASHSVGEDAGMEGNCCAALCCAALCCAALCYARTQSKEPQMHGINHVAEPTEMRPEFHAVDCSIAADQI